ncbi:MAG: hypothetical protein KJP25_10400 [Gammaproteobacteria bacterium]|nr:hypothetical protein [Gammaproteobacteria bacterium]NND40158.1 hypothetical protein [Pseudomonadales bacterium]NNL11604.1 hypothetical protein [Pseudomonadales bacterium]NNM12395.1 hypothetical protein [Pseudomonadales bacterium]
MLTRLILAICASIIGVTSWAQESVLPYTYVEAGYVRGEATGVDSQGFRVKGSKALNDFVYVSASYVSVLSDDPRMSFNGVTINDDVEVDQLDFGIGVHTVLDEVPDFVAEINFVQTDASAGSESERESGYRGAIGFRLPGGENYEVLTMINHTRMGSDRETGFELGARMRVGESNWLGLGFNKTYDLEMFALDLRLEL